MNYQAKPNEPRPWSFQRWFEHVATSLHKTPHRLSGCPGCQGSGTPEWHRTCLTVPYLTELYGLTEKTVQRWQKEGLTDRQADHLSVLAGFHPAEVFPGWDEVALTPLDELFVWGSETAEPGWRQAAVWAESSYPHETVAA